MTRRLGFGIWVLGFGIWASGLAPYVSAQAPQAWPIERMPPPLPARAVTFPPYDIQTLRNGLQVITVLHHEQPAVTMRLLVRAGGANDPDKKRGVAMLVSTLLDQGTTTRSSQQIADQIDSIGGVLGTGSGDDFTSVSAIVMKDSFGVAMEMVADVVRNPAFAAEEIDRQKEQITSTQQVNANDPDYLASAVFDRLVYGFHPYGLPGSGTPETMASITRQDLQQFHRQYFVPNNMVLAIVGDITQKDAAAAAERVFGSWPRGDVPAWRGPAPPEPTRRVVIVDKPDAVQTEIRVGQLAIARKHPDFLKWDLAVKVLGGEGANRLHRVLRSERGLTYGASADTEGRKLAGDIVAETDTRTDTTGEALRLMIEEFLRLQRLRVPERELLDAQAYLAGSFPLTIESPNDIATQVINYVLYELPLEEIPTYTKRVSAITPDDIQRVAQSYLKPDRLSIVLVGNARAFVPQLQMLGLTNVEIIPVEQLDLMSATLRRETGRRVSLEPFGSFGTFGAFEKPRPAYLAGQVNPRAGQPNVPNVPNAPNAPNDRTAMDLLRRVVDARGGLALLKGIKTVVADTVTTFQMQQGTLPSTTRTYIVYPDKFRVDAEINGAQTTQVFNAGTAWVKNPAGVQDAPAAMTSDFAASVRRDIMTLLVDAAEGRLTVRKLADQATQDGRPVQVLEVSGPRLDRVRLFIDQQMLIVGQAYSTPGPQARAILSEEVFSDYRFVSGIRVPFEAQLLQNGQPVLKRTITKVTFNEAVPQSLFTKPLQ